MFSFKLAPEYVESYRDKTVPWGYPDAAGTSLGEITFLRTYSRLKEDGSKETWVDVCERVINGMYSIQKDWCKDNRLPWNEKKAHDKHFCDHHHPVNFNVGKIAGGDWASSVPAWCTFDMRVGVLPSGARA